MSKEKNYKNYEDVTKKWLEKATPNSHDIVMRNYYIHNKVKYVVDGYNVVLKPSEKEVEIAQWLKEKLGGQISILPKINVPTNIQTADYLFRGQKFDLKSLTGQNNSLLYSRIRKSKGQSKNFIFDITCSPLTIHEIKRQVRSVYDKDNLIWFDIIIIKKEENIIGIYQRKN